jgi:hypothetical protein
MAAQSWAYVSDSLDVFGKHRVTVWNLVFSSTAYTAGGYAVTGATFGIKSILGMFCIGLNPSISATSSALPQYNAGTGKVQLFGTGSADTAALDEFAGTITATFTMLIISTSD